MNRRIFSTLALCSATIVMASAAPAAFAGNVAWGVSVGGPGFSVAAGQPGYYGGRGYYGTPYRPHFRPYVRPYLYPAFRGPVIVTAPVVYPYGPVAYPYYAPAPVVYAPRPVAYGPRAFVYANPFYATPVSPFRSSY
ncbi:MAG: hypothetical protein ABI624_05305 [Casimicrobiaceae bacterium]